MKRPPPAPPAVWTCGQILPHLCAYSFWMGTGDPEECSNGCQITTMDGQRALRQQKSRLKVSNFIRNVALTLCILGRILQIKLGKLLQSVRPTRSPASGGLLRPGPQRPAPGAGTPPACGPRRTPPARCSPVTLFSLSHYTVHISMDAAASTLPGLQRPPALLDSLIDDSKAEALAHDFCTCRMCRPRRLPSTTRGATESAALPEPSWPLLPRPHARITRPGDPAKKR